MSLFGTEWRERGYGLWEKYLNAGLSFVHLPSFHTLCPLLLYDHFIGSLQYTRGLRIENLRYFVQFDHELWIFFLARMPAGEFFYNMYM
jgi:hypothetical protein